MFKKLRILFFGLVAKYISRNSENIFTLINFIRKADNYSVIKGLLAEPRETEVVEAIFTRLAAQGKLEDQDFKTCCVVNIVGIPVDVLKNHPSSIGGLMERAIMDNNVEAIKHLHNAVNSYNYSLPCGLTPLEATCYYGAEDAFKEISNCKWL